MTLLEDRILSIAIARQDGAILELRRAGHLPDVFVDDSGRIFRLQEVNLTSHNGSYAFKYDGITLMAHHVVADAFYPGWDEEHPSIEYVDGDRRNLHPSNLRPSKDVRRGRPRSNELLMAFKALEILMHTRDLDATAEVSGYTPEILVQLMFKHIPRTLMNYKQLGIKGINAGLVDRIGMPREIRKLVTDGIIDVDVREISQESIAGKVDR